MLDLVGSQWDPCIVIADSIDVSSFFYLMIWVDVRMVLLTGGMCGACGRMAVYSQQPTMCWAPGCHGGISSVVASQNRLPAS